MYDVVIVGGGPAGLSAALILGRARRSVAVFDSGRPRNHSARKLHGYLGHDGTTPHKLRARGLEELSSYGVEVHSDTVVSAERVTADNHSRRTRFRIRTQSGREALCRKLLLATGVFDELPEIPGLAECYGVSVHHCPYCDGWEHRDEPLLAIGQSASAAVGLAATLRTWTSQVTALTEGNTLKAKDWKLLEKCDLRLCETPIARVVHEEGRMSGVELADGGHIDAQGLFFNTSQRPQSPLAEQLGCPPVDDVHPRTTPKQKSDRQGLYLAGDVDGDTQLAIVAAAEGATAAVAINRELAEEDWA
jgi:thioredoxin reductase